MHSLWSLSNVRVNNRLRGREREWGGEEGQILNIGEINKGNTWQLSASVKFKELRWRGISRRRETKWGSEPHARVGARAKRVVRVPDVDNGTWRSAKECAPRWRTSRRCSRTWAIWWPWKGASQRPLHALANASPCPILGTTANKPAPSRHGQPTTVWPLPILFLIPMPTISANSRGLLLDARTLARDPRSSEQQRLFYFFFVAPKREGVSNNDDAIIVYIPSTVHLHNNDPLPRRCNDCLFLFFGFCFGSLVLVWI